VNWWKGQFIQRNIPCDIQKRIAGGKATRDPFLCELTDYLGSADYLTGASNSRKRSRDSTSVQPLDDDAEVEDAGEK
jgi:hypothetical protein